MSSNQTPTTSSARGDQSRASRQANEGVSDRQNLARELAEEQPPAYEERDPNRPPEYNLAADSGYYPGLYAPTTMTAPTLRTEAEIVYALNHPEPGRYFSGGRRVTLDIDWAQNLIGPENFEGGYDGTRRRLRRDTNFARDGVQLGVPQNLMDWLLGRGNKTVIFKASELAH